MEPWWNGEFNPDKNYSVFERELQFVGDLQTTEIFYRPISNCKHNYQKTGGYPVNLFKFRFNSYSGDAKNKKIRKVDKMQIKLQEYKRFLGVQYNKQNSIDRYYNAAKHFLEFSNKINKESVENYICQLNKTKKKNTVVSEIIGLNKFLRYRNKSELCISTPRWEKINRDIATKQEIQNILRTARKNYNLMDYLMVLFVTDLDARPHEIIKSKWNWIKGNKIYFNGCKTGNTYGFLTNELQSNLEIWKTQQNPKSEYIFTNYYRAYKGKPLTSHGQKVRDFIHKITIEVIGRKLNPQDLRASVITAEFNSYLNPKIIQKKARHKSLKTTMQYNHITDNHLLEYLNKGTIFNNKDSLLQSKTEEDTSKPYDIKPFAVLQDTLINEKDNTTISFSIFSFLQKFRRFSIAYI